MRDSRRANTNWTLPDYDSQNVPFPAAQLAVLMDIRDAMQESNRRARALYCLLSGDPYRRGHIAMHKLRRHLEIMLPVKPKRKKRKPPLAVIRRRKT